jgi:hypothetical protein
MIKFLLMVAGLFILLPYIAGTFGGSAAVGLFVVVIAAVVFRKLVPFVLVGLVLLFVLMQSLRTATANGKDAAGRARAGAKAVGGDVVTRLLEKLGLKHVGTVAGGAQGVADAADDLALAQNICLNTSFARAKFGPDVSGTYCQRQDAGIFQKLKALLDGGGKGAAGPVFQFLTDETAALEANNVYLDCLRTASQHLPSITECYQKPFYDSVHSWRLCTELALQVKADDPMVRAPLAPEIAMCRARAPG